MNALIKKLEGDRVLWMITLLLSIISILAVYSSISTLAYKADGNSLKFLLKHTFMIGLGLFIMYHVHKMNYTYLSKVAKVFIWVAGILLLATLLFGVDINNAKRWLKVPVMGLTFQTSDFAKIVLILYTARMLNLKRLMFHNFKEGVLPVVYPIAIICGLILPADLSTAVLLGMICFMMMIIAGIPWKHLFKIIGAAIAVIVVIYLIGSSMPEVFPRFATWTSRINGFFVSNEGPNYQIDHALYAIHEGGFFPNGPGTGSSRNFMPHAYSDTIFAFIIQEYGSIIGGAFLILGYIILLFRSIKIGVKCPKNFGSMTAIGLSLMLVIQAFINMGVAVNLIPTTGQPLPLVSMGGTSMIFTCITIGVILSISRGVDLDSKNDHSNELSNQKTRKMPKKYIISGGGTGGHIFPAIAIANEIRKHEADSKILFVGALGKMEMEKVPDAGYEIIGLPIQGLQRKLTLKNLAFPFKLFKSMMKARRIVKTFKPDVAIGVGGYASGPLLKAASSKNVKCLIQEQNSYPGITNKLLSKSVDKICVSYDGLDRWFPKEKIIKTGNPVRSEVVQIENKKKEAEAFFAIRDNKKNILVIGGSLGARTINESISNSLALIKAADLQLIWQTGIHYFDTAQEIAKGYSNVKVTKFIKRMDLAYSAADYIISRAGAMSISELCLVNKPTILIPSPNVSEDHQTKNAMALVNNGAAILIKDVEAKEKLGKAIIDLSNDTQLQKELQNEISKMGINDAPKRIYNEIKSMCND